MPKNISTKTLTIFPLLLVFYEITTYLSNDMYLPALPSIMHDLNTTYRFTQLSITTWALGASSMQLFMGPLSDRYGRRPVLLLGGIVFVISTILCALSSTISFLLISRFFQGSAICSVVVAGYASIHELFDQHRAIKTLALMGSITVLAPAFGPLLGGIVLSFLNWRWNFWILALWATVALLLLYKFMPETNSNGKNQPIQIKRLFQDYYSIIANKNFTLKIIIDCLIFCSCIVWIAAGPFLVIDKFGYPVLMFGVFQACIFGCFILGARFVNKKTETLGVNKIIDYGITLALLGGLLAVLLSFIFPHYLIALIISLMINSLGAAFTFAPLQRLAIESSQAPMGARMAILSSAVSTFAAIASILVSIFYNGTLLSVASLVGILAALASLLYWKHRTVIT